MMSNDTDSRKFEHIKLAWLVIHIYITTINILKRF